MAESVMSSVQSDLTETITALNVQVQDDIHSATNLASAAVSDLATIVEAVNLGDMSEEEIALTCGLGGEKSYNLSSSSADEFVGPSSSSKTVSLRLFKKFVY